MDRFPSIETLGWSGTMQARAPRGLGRSPGLFSDTRASARRKSRTAPGQPGQRAPPRWAGREFIARRAMPNAAVCDRALRLRVGVGVAGHARHPRSSPPGGIFLANYASFWPVTARRRAFWPLISCYLCLADGTPARCRCGQGARRVRPHTLISLTLRTDHRHTLRLTSP